MYIVDTPDDSLLVLREIANRELLLVPVLSSAAAHPVHASIAVIYGKVLDTGFEFMIPMDHLEACNEISSDVVSSLFQGSRRIYTPLVKIFHFHGYVGNFVDLVGLKYFVTGEMTHLSEFQSPRMREFIRSHSSTADPYTIYPLLSYVSYFREIATALEENIRQLSSHIEDEEIQFLHSVTLPVTCALERNLVCVTSDIQSHFPHIRIAHQSCIPTEYNPYTITRRVTNRFDGINFSALNKSSGVRKSFVSRHANGALVLIDFESFHLRLIAEMIGYEFPTDEPVHQYLAKQYYQKDTISQEEYDAGKQLTFSLLYGDAEIPSEIEFFVKISRFIDVMYTELKETGRYRVSGCPYVLRWDMLESPSPAKAFNYLIQMSESATAFRLMQRALQVLSNGQKSAITLYTYDSILVDFCYDDGKNTLVELVRCLESDGKFPVRVHAGHNYHDMQQITNIVKTQV